MEQEMDKDIRRKGCIKVLTIPIGTMLTFYVQN